MGTRHRAVWSILVALALVGCTLGPLATPTPRPTPTPSPTPSPSPTPIPPTPTPVPTPDATAIPMFTAGELIATAIDGLRVHQRPGVGSVVVTGLLPLNATLEVVMGPILFEEMGWYLVTDADPDEPQFEEGWIASGFAPDAFLTTTGISSEGSPFIASFAQVGDAQYGPISIEADTDYAIRWVAVDPERQRCEFAVEAAAGTGEPVRAIRATIGNDLVPGTLQPNAFAALALRGQIFLTITSDCAWTLVVQRVPSASPLPSPTSGP